MKAVTLLLAVTLPALILSGAQQVADAAHNQVGKWPYSYVRNIL